MRGDKPVPPNDKHIQANGWQLNYISSFRHSKEAVSKETQSRQGSIPTWYFLSFSRDGRILLKRAAKNDKQISCQLTAEETIAPFYLQSL